MDEKTRELLLRWEQWEANLLNSDNYNIVDVMGDKEYEEFLELQLIRNELLKDRGISDKG